MVNQVWKDKGLPKGLINKEVTTAFAKHLLKAVDEGFGSPLLRGGAGGGVVDYDTPDFTMLKSLQENTWQFAAAKNYTQLRELSDALLDENGKLRSFNDFKTVANSINDKHVGRYLNAEYEHAVSSSQMASKWVDIEKNNPKLLEFDAVMDAGTSAICANLNGTRLPVSHPFWNRYYPPNHFGCRSTVRELYSGVATVENKIPTANIQPLFQTNLAKDGLVYPKGHTYFKDMPKEVIIKLNSKAKILAKQSVYDLPIEEQFDTIYESKTGGIVKQHKLHLPKPKDVNDDYFDIIDASKLFANKGDIVEILPEIHVTEEKARKLILKSFTNDSANPDYRINGIYMDLKRPKKHNIVHKAIEATEQESIPIIKCKEGLLSNEEIKYYTSEIFGDINFKKDEVYFINGQKLINQKRD